MGTAGGAWPKSLASVSHLHRNDCGRIIFSNSASIYQAEDGSPVSEDSLLARPSPYVRTKVCKEMSADIAVTGPGVLSLRYRPVRPRCGRANNKISPRPVFTGQGLINQGE